MNVIEALRDTALLGALPAFRDLSSWRTWLAFLKAVYGLPLGADELATFRRHTGRQEPKPGGYPEAVAIVGRQAGKSQIASALASFEAATSRARRGSHVLLIAQDLRGAQRALLNYCKEIFTGIPIFEAEVERETADTLELRNGISLSVYPCRPSSVRGIRSPLVIVDELAFFIATDGLPTDREMLRSVRPTLATTGGKLIVLSSPYGQSGALWDLHRTHFGKDDSPTLVWQADAASMNPTLPTDYLQRMEQDDPEAYRSEVLGEFRAGVASLFDPAALDAVVVFGRRELTPEPSVRYRAFVDPSGGRGDSFTVAIGHVAAGRAVVDAMRVWHPPFNPSSVVAEVAVILTTYRIAEVTGDRYGGEWPREAFRSHGVSYEAAEMAKSDLYLGMLPHVNAGTVELLDLPDLLRELRGLERRRGASGRDRVDHRPGSHDDQANAVAGLLSLLSDSASRQADDALISLAWIAQAQKKGVEILERRSHPDQKGDGRGTALGLVPRNGCSDTADAV